MKTLIAVSLILGCAAAFAGDTPAKKPKQAAQAVPEEKAQAKPAAASEAAKPEVTARKIGKAELGKEAFCPVTGDKVKISTETVSVSYKNRNYYFCCNDCDALFRANPEQYAVKDKPETKAKKAVLYVCPMGDYQGDKPGKCPKCGMTLVQKK